MIDKHCPVQILANTNLPSGRKAKIRKTIDAKGFNNIEAATLDYLNKHKGGRFIGCQIELCYEFGNIYYILEEHHGKLTLVSAGY